MKILLQAAAIIGMLVLFGFFIEFNCMKTLPKSETSEIDKNLSINWDNKFRGDTFTIATVRQAVIYARQNHQLVDSILIDSMLTKHGYDYDAMDIVKGDTLFTRVTLSETSDSLATLNLIRVGLRSNRGPDKTLEAVILGLLADYRLKKLEKAKKHG